MKDDEAMKIYDEAMKIYDEAMKNDEAMNSPFHRLIVSSLNDLTRTPPPEASSRSG